MTANKPITLWPQTTRVILPVWQEAHTANDTGIACATTLVSDDYF